MSNDIVSNDTTDKVSVDLTVIKNVAAWMKDNHVVVISAISGIIIGITYGSIIAGIIAALVAGSLTQISKLIEMYQNGGIDKIKAFCVVIGYEDNNE